MKRVTSYALNCLMEQGISNENIKKLVKAIESQTIDNILTPEQAIEILLDGEIHVEKIHQQDTTNSNSGRFEQSPEVYERILKMYAE